MRGTGLLRSALAVLLLAALLGLAAGCGGPVPSYDRSGGQPGSDAAVADPPVPGTAFVATVERVVDGDTFLARRDGRLVRVRLIGIDAPESVTPDVPVECYGPEAARLLRTLLSAGSTVRAAHQPGGDRDRYGRQLWDVWLDDGRLVQAVLVERGAARARVYPPQRRYAVLLATLDAQAGREGAGLHGQCTSPEQDRL